MADDLSYRGWHLRKEVTVGNIFTMCVAIAAVSVVLADQDKRIDLNKQSIESMRIGNIQREDRMVRTLNRVDSTLVRIETKLDSKADK